MSDTPRTIQFFESSPDAGHPDCLCSWCGKLITEEQAPAIRLSLGNLEARFHGYCYLVVNALPSTPPEGPDE